MRNIKISPSLLSANFANLKQDLEKVESCCEMIHLDVMDGVFVPNISFGIPVIKSIRKATNLFFDTHLMIQSPKKYVHEFALSGVDLITFHLEACLDQEEIIETIELIKKEKKKVGISIKPTTPVETIYSLLLREDIDLVLIMSVEPGFGGQKFMKNSISKIRELRKFIDENRLGTLIEVDGGIQDETAKLVIDAGADILVSGSYLFNSEDFNEAVESLFLEL